MNIIQQGVASYIMAQIENETTVDRFILTEDQGFIDLFCNSLNQDKISIDSIIADLKNYVNNNY